MEALADLRIVKTDAPDPATPGNGLTYQIVVTNLGPSDAQDVEVLDMLPAELSNVTVTSFPPVCSGFPCTIGTLPAGESVLIQVQATVAADALGVLTNTAIVTSSTPLTNTVDDSSTVTTTLTPKADLALVKTATPTVNAGEEITYTLTVYNNGPSQAQDVVVTDTLPADVTFTSASAGCSQATLGVVVCTVGTLPAGQAAALVVVVKVDDDILTDLKPNVSLENRVVVASSTPDPNPDNNAADADTSVGHLADLVLDKRGPSTLVAGDLVTYTIVVTNSGPSVAQSVDIKDELPAGVQFQNASVQRSGAGNSACPSGAALCQVGDMAQGEVVTMTVVGRVDPSLPDGTTLTNSATAFTNTPDPNQGNNTDTSTGTTGTLARLRIDKRDLVDPVGPEALLVYSIRVFNDGPSEARDVKLTDLLPPGVTYVNNTDNCAETIPGVLVYTLGTVVAHGSTNFLIVVRVHADVASNTVLRNNAIAESTTPLAPDSVLTDFEDTIVRQLFGPPADLALEKQASSAAVLASGLVTYTLIVTNYGPATATDVKVVDALPAGLTSVSVHASQGLCDSGVTCLLGTMVYDGTPRTAQITIVARAAPDVPEGTQLVNISDLSITKTPAVTQAVPGGLTTDTRTQPPASSRLYLPFIQR